MITASYSYNFGLLNRVSSIGSNLLSESVVVVPTYNYLFGPTTTTRSPSTASYYVQPERNDFVYDQSVMCSGETLNGETTEVTCTRNDHEIPCSNYHKPGETAFVRCKTGYMMPSSHIIKSDFQCLSSGQWSSPIYECVANCGKLTKKSKVNL